MPDVDAIVIGSGPGGLAAGLTLAREGLLVLVLEQHYLPGGYCHSFPLGGHLWSPGVHYIGHLEPGGPARRFYEALGVSDELVFCALCPDAVDVVRLPDGRSVPIPAGATRRREQLAAAFPADSAGIHAWFDAMEALGQGAGLLSARPAEARADPALARWGGFTVDALLRQLVRDPAAAAVLAARGPNYGLPPSRAPVQVHAEMEAHYAEGGAFPLGGGRAIPRAFVHALHREGAELQVRARVTEILTEPRDGGRKAVGVRLANGETILAGVVVSNADPDVTFRRLVGWDHLSEALRARLDQVLWSPSCLSLFVTAELDPAALGLRSSNTWVLSDLNLERGYAPEVLTGEGPLPQVFATVTTLKDPTARRGGVHALEAFAMAPYAPFARWAGTPHGRRSPEYEALKQRLTGRMLDALCRMVPDLRERLRFCALGTPLTNQHFCEATRGAIYGTDKSVGRGNTRSFITHTEIADLHLCGSSTFNHGVYGAGLTGLYAASQILGVPAEALLSRPGPPLRVVPADHPERWPEDLRARVRSG